MEKSLTKAQNMRDCNYLGLTQYISSDDFIVLLFPLSHNHSLVFQFQVILLSIVLAEINHKII